MAVATCTAGIQVVAPALAQGPVVTAFVDVTVIPMDQERVLPAQTVVVKGDKIVQIGPVNQVTLPAGATVIDGHGKFLLPGLVDMHVHISYFADSLDADKQLLFFLAEGVTTIRDMRSHARHLALRDRVARGELLGPQIYTAARVEECLPQEPKMQCIPRLKALGYDFFKAYSPGRAELDSIAAAARQAGLPIVGHSPLFQEGGVEAALRAPYSSVEHMVGYDEYLVGQELTPPNYPGVDTAAAWLMSGAAVDSARLHAIVAMTIRAQVWNTPTLRTMMGAAGVVPHRRFELRQILTKALHDAGAGLLLGTDVQLFFANTIAPIVQVSGELEELTAAGLTPYQALETGTRNAAAYLGTLAQTGTVEVGKRADLVLLEGNPLQDIHYTAKPFGVMVRGRWMTRDALVEAAGTYAPD